jgi:hypothetical protein
MDNAESVRQFQPRVALWQPLENLKELRRRLLPQSRATLSGLRTICPGIFEPRVSKQTLG